jgi:hypothetical protein
MVSRYRQILGWFAVGLSTLAACFWAFWGILENLHEGWYYPSLWMNLSLMVVQYLVVTLLVVGAGVVGIRWPRVGGTVHIAAALGAAWRFRGASPAVVYELIVGPLVVMGICYWLGRAQPRRWAVAAVVGCPLITLVICGAEPAYRVSGRWDDGDRGMRLVQGNGIQLTWAPEGPGWPKHGVTWHEAVRRCRYLTAEGLVLADTPQNIWRLPTTEEVVRSLCRHGRNAGGAWDADSRSARFQIAPDKESPLWDVHSMIIYWWTSTEVDSDRALRISHNGHVMPLPKKVGYGYLGFRAVKEPGRSQGE